jgi:hypothetical protein
VCLLFQKFRVSYRNLLRENRFAWIEIRRSVHWWIFFFIGGHMDLSGITCDSENFTRRKYSTVKAGKPSIVDRVWFRVLKSHTNWCVCEVLSWAEMWDANQASPPTKIPSLREPTSSLKRSTTMKMIAARFAETLGNSKHMHGLVLNEKPQGKLQRRKRSGWNCNIWVFSGM